MSGVTRRVAITGAIAGASLAPTIARTQTVATNQETAASVAVQPVMPALTAYIAQAQTATVPEAIRDRARLHILDTLASIVACRDLEAGRLGRNYASATGGAGKTTILGTRNTGAIVDAVFASAMTGHAAEINDFIPSAYVQPGPSIVSASIALAELRGLSGRHVTSAVIAGYELAGRIPKSIGTPALYRAGIANHGVGPVFGTGAAAASLLGMTEDAVRHVISYCAQQASGSWQWLLDIRHIEKAFVFAGMGARNGLQAALMVDAGFTGVPDSLDVEGGWLRSDAFKNADRASLVAGLGERFELSHGAFKRYPTGGPTQPAVKALLELSKQVNPADVTGIRIEMPGRADAFAGAKMPALNLPYIASLIMLDGKLDFVDVQSLDRMHGDADVASFRKLVEVVEDKAQEAAPGQPRVESARVIIQQRGKPDLQQFEPYVIGFPSHPMSRADVEAKARELVEPHIGAARTDQLIARTAALDDERSMTAIIATIAR